MSANRVSTLQTPGVGPFRQPRSTEEGYAQVVIIDGSISSASITTSEIASDGLHIPFDSLAKTITYNVDDTINYITAIYNGNTYRKSFTYGSGTLTISNWVKQ